MEKCLIMKNTSIVVPICNEEDVLNELILRINKTMNNHLGNDWELLLIDDNSSDNSYNIMKENSEKNNKIRVFHHPKNKGQTGCFKTGFSNANGRITITMDGDLQLFPEDLPLFIDKIEQGYDVINGIREHRQHSFTLRFASRIFNTLMLLFFNTPVIDAASNFTAFRTKFIKGLNLVDNDHRYIIPIAIKRGARVIGEVVVRHTARKGGKSKYKVFKKFISGGPEIMLAWLRIRSGKYSIKKD